MAPQPGCDDEAARLLLQYLILEAQLVKTGLHRPRADCPRSYGLTCGLSGLLCLACQLFRVLLDEVLETHHPCTCLSFQWLLAKHAMRVFGRRRERLSGVCDLRRVASGGIPKRPPRLAADAGKGFAREGLLRGKTCSVPFRPCVPGEGSGRQQFLIGGSGCNAVHRGNQPHDVVGFDGLFRRCLGRILRQVFPQTLKTGAFVCRERRQGFDLLCVSTGVQRGKRLPHGRSGLPGRRRKDRIAGLLKLLLLSCEGVLHRLAGCSKLIRYVQAKGPECNFVLLADMH